MKQGIRSCWITGIFAAQNFKIIQGYHLLWQNFPIFFDISIFLRKNHHLDQRTLPSSIFTKDSFNSFQKPFPGSLATTTGISVDFYSFSYLDVSVHWVIEFLLGDSIGMSQQQNLKGFPSGYLWITERFVSPHSVSLRFTSFLSIPRHPFNAFYSFKNFYYFIVVRGGTLRNAPLGQGGAAPCRYFVATPPLSTRPIFAS